MQQFMSRVRIEAALTATRHDLEEVMTDRREAAGRKEIAVKEAEALMEASAEDEEPLTIDEALQVGRRKIRPGPAIVARQSYYTCMNLLIRLANLKTGLFIIDNGDGIVTMELTPVIRQLAYEVGNVATEDAFGLSEMCAALAQVSDICRD